MTFCQLYAKGSFRGELAMKPRNGPYGEGGPFLGRLRDDAGLGRSFRMAIEASLSVWC
jgi:hypothetical protein